MAFWQTFRISTPNFKYTISRFSVIFIVYIYLLIRANFIKYIRQYIHLYKISLIPAG